MYSDRIRALSQAMKKANLGAVLVCPSEEMIYLTGFSPLMCERFQALFVTEVEQCFYICNQLYAGEIAHELGPEVPIYTWQDGHSMTQAAQRAFEDYQLLDRTIAVNSTAQAFNILQISRDTSVSFCEGVSVLEESRIVKSPAQIQALRDAGAIADKAFEKVLGFIRPGVTEGQIRSFLLQTMGELGGSKCWCVVPSGPNSGYPHYQGVSRRIEEKDLMVLDFGCVVNGMYSDMSRMVFVGDASEEERNIYNIVLRSHLAGEQAAVNGAFIPDVDRAARQIIEDAGYGREFFLRVGHGIGYMNHEAPDIKANNRRYLEPGMAFSIEPGIYIPGRLGMRVEDIVVVTENGNEIMNKAPKELIIV